jgi:hypothetical protein
MAVFIGAIRGYRGRGGYSGDPRIMSAKFDSRCAESGRKIRKGDTILYYPLTKQAFLVGYAPNAEKDYAENKFDQEVMNYQNRNIDW